DPTRGVELATAQCAQMHLQLHPMRMTMTTSPLERYSAIERIIGRKGTPPQPASRKQQSNQPSQTIMKQKLRQEH
ncbi:hypothetical protein S245_044866, partial [Arachis hypogaea]